MAGVPVLSGCAVGGCCLRAGKDIIFKRTYGADLLNLSFCARRTANCSKSVEPRGAIIHEERVVLILPTG